jgi:hypothetical protein
VRNAHMIPGWHAIVGLDTLVRYDYMLWERARGLELFPKLDYALCSLWRYLSYVLASYTLRLPTRALRLLFFIAVSSCLAGTSQAPSCALHHSKALRFEV